MDDPQANAAKSRIPRFSLRTLLILMALAGSGYALYAGWREPWGHLCTLTIPCPEEAKEVQHTCGFDVTWKWFSKDDEKLLICVNHSYGEKDSPRIGIAHFHLYDLNTRDIILTKEWSSQYPNGSYPSGVNVAVISEDEKISLYFEITTTIQPGALVLYGHTMDTLSYISPQGTRRALYEEYGQFDVQQRRRPDAWYGAFWLPEFYLVALCAIGLAWSIRRDVKVG